MKANSKATKTNKAKPEYVTVYNVKMFVRFDGVVRVGDVLRFKENPKGRDGGQWVRGSTNKIVRVLKKGELAN